MYPYVKKFLISEAKKAKELEDVETPIPTTTADLDKVDVRELEKDMGPVHTLATARFDPTAEARKSKYGTKYGSTDLPLVTSGKVARHLINTAYAVKRPILIYGDPGVSKSASIRQAAESIARQKGKEYVMWNEENVEGHKELFQNPEKYFVLIDVRAVGLEPTDITGLPFKGRVDIKAFNSNPDQYISDNSQKFKMLSRKVLEPLRFKWIEYVCTPGADGILLFDELNQAHQQVQMALYQVFLDRYFGDSPMSKDYGIAAAGNLGTSHGSNELLPAFIARTDIFYYILDVEDWLQWAEQPGLDGMPRIDDLVTAFVASNPTENFRAQMIEEANPVSGFPNPRNFEVLSKKLRHEKATFAQFVQRGEAAPDSFYGIIEAHAASTCGHFWASRFMNFVRYFYETQWSHIEERIKELSNMRGMTAAQRKQFEQEQESKGRKPLTKDVEFARFEKLKSIIQTYVTPERVASRNKNTIAILRNVIKYVLYENNENATILINMLNKIKYKPEQVQQFGEMIINNIPEAIRSKWSPEMIKNQLLPYVISGISTAAGLIFQLNRPASKETPDVPFYDLGFTPEERKEFLGTVARLKGVSAYSESPSLKKESMINKYNSFDSVIKEFVEEVHYHWLPATKDIIAKTEKHFNMNHNDYHNPLDQGNLLKLKQFILGAIKSSGMDLEDKKSLVNLLKDVNCSNSIMALLGLYTIAHEC